MQTAQNTDKIITKRLNMSKRLKKFRKKVITPILFNPLTQWLLAFMIAGLIWFIYLTSKRRFTNKESLKQYRNKPVVFVFFHGRSAMLSPVIKSAHIPAYCIASRHKDGRMMARLQRLFGMRAIYGSTTDGGVAVLRQGVKTMREKNASICISVDGPSGPSMCVHDGALYFARMTGAPIVPCCFSASRAMFLNRWDRFLIPKLFGTLTVNIGEPIYVDSKLSGVAFEEKRKEIEEIMVKQLRDMDAEFNLFHVERGIKSSEFKKQHKK